LQEKIIGEIMAKTYLSTVKYEVLANYEVAGVVEKPDIVGAIFGQCEGLLGEDMDLKELQQSGKIGRIEITVKKGKGTTFGEIIIPSSLDQVKTSILAATIETVEKVGPFDTKVKVTKIQDTRKEKRETITDRAKELLKHMQKFDGVESSELADTIKSEIKTEKVITFRGLTAGPEVETNPEIIVVEGRADVLKLLSYGINNAVAMNGGNIDAPLIGLCKEKTVTALIDGDRGGEMNVKKLASLTKVDYVAKAPDGKEVEELVQKEILQALKRRVVLADAFKETSAQPAYQTENTYTPRTEGYAPRQDYGNRGFHSTRHDRGRSGGRYGDRREGFNPRHSNSRYPDKPRFERGGYDKPRFSDRSFNRYTPGTSYAPTYAPIQREEAVPQDILDMKKDFDKLKGKSKARLLDEKKKKIKDVEVKDMLETIQKSKKKIHTILFDGIITNRLIEAAEGKGIQTIVGVKKGSINPQKVKAYTM
jgi:DNA primase